METNFIQSDRSSVLRDVILDDDRLLGSILISNLKSSSTTIISNHQTTDLSNLNSNSSDDLIKPSTSTSKPPTHPLSLSSFHPHPSLSMSTLHSKPKRKRITPEQLSILSGLFALVINLFFFSFLNPFIHSFINSFIFYHLDRHSYLWRSWGMHNLHCFLNHSIIKNLESTHHLSKSVSGNCQQTWNDQSRGTGNYIHQSIYTLFINSLFSSFLGLVSKP